MARKRPGYVAVRRIVAGMCIFVGLFVACFGLGNGRQSVLVAGVAIMVLAASTRVATSFRRTPREWLRGVGRVVEVSDPPTEAQLGRCSLQLAVEVPGMPEETVLVHDSRVPVSQWPSPGQELPIQVAADDVRNVRVLWRDFVPVEMPLEAAWGDDQPGPAPATPPGSHLDPSPVIDFDLDQSPPAPLRPVAPPHPVGTEPASPPGETALAEVAPATAAPAEASAPDVGRVDADAPLPGEPPGGTDALADIGDEPAGAGRNHHPDQHGHPEGDDRTGQPGGPEATAHQDEQARLATAAPVAATASRVPRPRPQPRPSPRPRREPAPVPAEPAPAGAVATDFEDLVSTYPSAHTGPAGAINGVGVTVLVADLARSATFYRDKLGFYEVDNGAETMVLASGETRLVLRQADSLGAVKRRLVHLNLEVGDIDATYAELRANGVRFTYPPRPVDRTARLRLWAAPFRDPDGHGIALIQWRPIDDPQPPI